MAKCRSYVNKLLALEKFNYNKHKISTLKIGAGRMAVNPNLYSYTDDDDLDSVDDSLKDWLCTPEDYDRHLIQQMKLQNHMKIMDDSWIPPINSKKTVANINYNSINKAVHQAMIQNQQVASSKISTLPTVGSYAALQSASSTNPVTVPNNITPNTYIANSSSTDHSIDNFDPGLSNKRYRDSDLPTFENSVAHLLYFAQSQTGASLSAAMRSIMSDIRLEAGTAAKLSLPDGTIVDINTNGNYTINDSNAKVVYRANRNREFNPYINVSERLEEFILYCGKLGVTQGEMLQIPIELFIMWLVVESARADQIEESEQPLLDNLKKLAINKCDQCGRFMKKVLKRRQINQCSSHCFELACSAA